jgi:hypothetical protein
MMEALRVMTYFKVSLSTCNWDSAMKKGNREVPLSFDRTCHVISPDRCDPSGSD